MPWPQSDLPALLPAGTRQNQMLFEGNLQGFLAEEHHDDGSHADITADSISILSANGQESGVGIFNDVTFAPSIYRGSLSMKWTVALSNQITLKYELAANKMSVIFYIDNTNVGGTPNIALQIAMPLGLKPTSPTVNACFGRDKGTSFTGYAFVTPNAGAFAGFINVFRSDGAFYQATAGNDTGVFGEIFYPVG